ncbi:MAG: sigma 54-interacting transcriptional regulator [Desulfobacterales bacterium]|nr:sigma 54-interacting transcriptional regulator [Desulfobacterales bacterium]
MNPKKILNDQFVKLLLESLGDGVFTLDSDGFITSWNPAMVRISGYGVDEAIGKSCGLMSFSQCFGKQCPINPNKCGIFDSGKVDPTECYLKHKTGRSVPVIKNARVIRKPDGSVIGIVEAVTDLTELEKARKKMAEDSLRLGKLYQFENIIGKSHVMQQVFSSIKAAAACNATVLIQGESGTGKELVAGAIHFESDRKNSRMITVNCSALPESLLESELFGHIRGAFTGALRDRKGRFEDADGGTIFLDEIGEISPLIQLKLLRVLEEHSIERVGESKSRKINIRIITATNQDLFQLVNAGNFREDLYYRLKVFPIYPPPLRKRKEDIPLLVNHFIDVFNQKAKKQIRGISQSAMRLFMDYEWPGNVRELENALEHAFVLCQEDQIDLFDIPVEIRQFDYYPRTPDPPPPWTRKSQPAQKLSRELLLRLLTECQWNKAEVARRVGLSRAAIWKYMKKYDIPLKAYPNQFHE